MSIQPELQESCPPDHFVVQVFSEMGETTIQRRWREINTILRLSMLSGLPMQLETALNMLCDFAMEIAPYDKAALYFWEDSAEQVSLRVSRGEVLVDGVLQHGNIFHFWVSKLGVPC